MKATLASAVIVGAALLALGGSPEFMAMAGQPGGAKAVQGDKPHTTPGPTPARLPDGKPNWTGFWVPVGGLLEGYRGPSGVEGVPGGITINTPRADPTAPAMKSPYKEELQKLLQRAKNGEQLPDKVALCFPPGMPQMMVMVYGMEILQTPNIIAMTSEWQAASRRIWMDLKEHPPADERDDTYAGHSIGHWEGNTLVVDTVGIRTDVSYFNQIPATHSDKTRIIERFHQTAPDTLVDNMTLIDPDVFVKPWVRTFSYHYRPDLRLQEYVCLDNNRAVDKEGRAKF